MRLNTAVREFDTSMQLQQRTFTIAASAKMFQILSNSLYKHKELAIVRELTANAYDAHIRAGEKTRPIELHLPTPLEPWFEIKDYGTGLSDQAIYDLYTRYGGSDKTDTNDEIGGFGLGSKSPFAYTDQFSVESRYDGVKRRYHAFIDSAGIPQVAKIGEEPTNEPNGLTVHIPVQPSGFSAFHQAAANILAYLPLPYKLNTSLAVQKPEYVGGVTIDGVQVRPKRSGAPRVIMGIVPYPIDAAPFIGEGLVYDIILRIPFDIYAPIGAFEIAASREALSYTQAVKDKIKRILPMMLIPLAEEVKKQVDAAATLFDAWDTLRNVGKQIADILQMHPGKSAHPKIQELYNWFKKPTWRGQPVELKFPLGIAVRRVYKLAGDDRTFTASISADNSESVHYFSWYTALEKPAQLYWKESHTAPFMAFFQDDPNAKMPAWVLSGDREEVKKLVTSWGIDFDTAVEELPEIKRKRGQSSSSSARYGNRLYYMRDKDGEHNKHFHELKSIAKKLVVCTAQPNIGHIRTLLDRLHGFGAITDTGYRDLAFACIPAAHKRVIRELKKAGAMEGLDEVMKCDLIKTDRRKLGIASILWRSDARDALSEALKGFGAAKCIPPENNSEYNKLIQRLKEVDEELVELLERGRFYELCNYYHRTVFQGLNVLSGLEEQQALIDFQKELEEYKKLGEKLAARYPMLADKKIVDPAWQYVYKGPLYCELLIHYLKTAKGASKP